MGPVRRDWIIEKLFSTNVEPDLLALFNQNPTLIKRTERATRKIAIRPREIEDDPEDLLGVGFCCKENVRGNELISSDRKRAAEIMAFLTNKISKSLEPE